MMTGIRFTGTTSHPARPTAPQPKDFDVLIQGGGINGAATAEELARRGLKVGLIEMNDIGAGTTAYSSRLIHGGLRYLEPFKGMLTPWRLNGLLDSFKFSEHIGLVRESLREREILLNRAPHLVRPLPLALPAYEGATFNKRNMTMSMELYDKLSYDKSVPKYKKYTLEALKKLLPGLANAAEVKSGKLGKLQGGAVYYDAQVAMPERLALEHALAAKANGASVFNHTRVDEVLTEPLPAEKKRFSRKKVTTENRQATGVRATDLLTGEELVLNAKVVINATGSWVDRALKTAKPAGADADFERRMGGTKGSHILVKRFNDALTDQALSFESSDGRHMFIEPYNKDYLLIGTTDLHYEGDPADAVADQDELNYLVAQTNRVFPDAELKTDDILWAYSGVRPLPYAPPGTKPGQITRKHIVEDHTNDAKHPIKGLVSLIGGKITTARSLAEEAADQIIEDYGFKASPFRDWTKVMSLPGGRDIQKGGLETYKTEAWQNAKTTPAKRPWLRRAVMEHLIDLYGSQYKFVLDIARQKDSLKAPLAEGSPNIAAQVAFAVRHEFAGTVSDVMRRTGAVLNEHAGLDELDGVAKVLIEELRWPEEIVQRDVQEYRDYVAKQNGELWKLQGANPASSL